MSAENALERGRLAKIEWLQRGFLVPPKDYAAGLGVKALDLRELEARGDIFSVEVEGQLLYPSEALKMPSSVVAQICHALVGRTPSERMIFIMRSHGSLGGRTVSEAVASGELVKVLQLANAWNLE